MLNDGVTKLIPNILTIIAILVIMMIKNIWLSLSAILVLPLIAIGMYFIQIVAHKRMADVPEKIFQCYGVYPRGLLRYPHHQELYRRAGIAGRV